MTVAELIDILSDLDPDARVYLMTQKAWPFENRLAGVSVRSEFEEVDDDKPEGDAYARPSDVFLCEGDQLRYGSADAWNVLAE